MPALRIPTVTCLAILAQAPLAAEPPTIRQFAHAASVAYNIQFGTPEQAKTSLGPLLQQGYELFDYEEDRHLDQQVGYRAVALRNPATKTVIIAYRGTDPTDPRNLVVDAGIFLTVAGADPATRTYEALHRFLDHYQARGSNTLDAVAFTALAASKSMPGVELTPLGRVVAAVAKDAALIGVFGKMGLPYDPNFPIEAHTRAIVRHGQAFYQKTLKHLYETVYREEHPKADENKAQAQFEPSKGKRLLYWSGAVGDPRRSPAPGYSVYVTGHSLGGFLAQIVAAHAGCPAVTFNAPGAKEFVQQHAIKLKDDSGILNIYRVDDIVGSFGTHLGQDQCMVNFYESRRESDRLQALYDQEEAELEPERERRFRDALAQHQGQMDDYRQLKRVHDEDRKNFEPSLEAYRKKHRLEASYLRMGWEWMVGTSLPDAPGEPTLKQMVRVVPNRFGETARERAQAAYGLPGYLLRNHSLAGIIEEMEADSASGERPEEKSDGKSISAVAPVERKNAVLPSVPAWMGPGGPDQPANQD